MIKRAGRMLESMLAEFVKDPTKVRETLASVFEAAQGDRDRLEQYGPLGSSLHFLSTWLSTKDFELPESEIRRFTLAVIFAVRLTERLEQRFDPSANN